MTDFYYARYQGLSHQELYNMLKAGDPSTMDSLSASWSALGGTAGSLSGDLHRDLTALGNTWHGEASTEFQRRLGAIVEFSATLSTEFNGLHLNAAFMAGSLRVAQSKMEDPAATDDNDKAVSGAVEGAAKFSFGGIPTMAIGAVMGAVDGHSQDVQEQEKAHQRMIAVVAGLAADYALASSTMDPTNLQPEPPALPTGAHLPAVHTGGVGGGGPVSGAPGVGHAGTTTNLSLTTSAPSPGPGTGTDSTGSGLLGAGSLTGVGPPAALGPGSGGRGSLADGALLAGGGGLTLGGLAAATHGSMRPGGPTTGAGSTSGAAGSSVAPRTGSGTDGVLGREAETRAAMTARGNAAGRGANGNAIGPNGRGDEDDVDERTTWLTEDDMDWGAKDAAPSVLGERPGPAPEETGTHHPTDPA